MTCTQITMSLGAYLLGALDAQERAAVDAHLLGCPGCRAELSDLAALPSILDQLSFEDFAVEAPEVPADLFDRVAAKARHQIESASPQSSHDNQSSLGSHAGQSNGDSLSSQVSRGGRPSRGRRRQLIAIAAGVVLLAGGSAVVVHGGFDGGHHVYRSSAGGPVQMQVTLSSQTTGTALRVEVSGLPADEHCRLIAIAGDGERDVAGRWDATYSGRAQETGSTAIPQSQLSRLVLLGTHGQQLATVQV